MGQVVCSMSEKEINPQDRPGYICNVDDLIIKDKHGVLFRLGRSHVFDETMPWEPRTINLETSEPIFDVVIVKKRAAVHALIIVWTLRALALLSGFALVMWGKQ